MEKINNFIQEITEVYNLSNDLEDDLRIQKYLLDKYEIEADIDIVSEFTYILSDIARNLSGCSKLSKEDLETVINIRDCFRLYDCYDYCDTKIRENKVIENIKKIECHELYKISNQIEKKSIDNKKLVMLFDKITSTETVKNINTIFQILEIPTKIYYFKKKSHKYYQDCSECKQFAKSFIDTKSKTCWYHDLPDNMYQSDDDDYNYEISSNNAGKFHYTINNSYRVIGYHMSETKNEEVVYDFCGIYLVE